MKTSRAACPAFGFAHKVKHAVNRVLMICEKFPPFNVSGSARPFYFAKYLREFGYEPTVLTATVSRGDERDDALLAELDPNVGIWRTPRLLSPLIARWRARQSKQPRAPEATGGAAGQSAPGPLSRVLPDLGWWVHWEVDWVALATLAGWLGAHWLQPDVIWVSGPHFRDYAVACRLSAWLGKPLVVDLRDPWTYGSLWRPKTPRIAGAESAWAERVLSQAARVVFTSPLTLEAMHARFPGVPRERWVTITNGFDDYPVEPLRGVPEDVCLFRYIGVLNDRRKPDALISAFALACQDPELRASAALELIGNAAGHESKVGLAPGCQVRFRGHVSRAESLRYMFGSDVNVLLQTISEGEDVVSGKAFDYLHARKPILAVVDPGGGDAWLMRETNAGKVASWSDVDAIAREMKECWRAWKTGEAHAPKRAIDRFSRRALTEQLALLFDDVLAEAGARRSDPARAPEP
jgi:hypothetical protein